MLSRFKGRECAVSIQESWLERCRHLCPNVAWTPVDPKTSPLASLQALLRARPAVGPFFVWHVDQPVWDNEIFGGLEKGLGENEAARPLRDGKRGHPVLLSGELGLRILALNPVSERLDEYLRTRKIADVAVDSARCLENWNGGVPA
jgi:CTP:molybdopterin cytidylyltransferase MocA